MRVRLVHLCMLIAWLLATGVQWDVMQVFAWGRMFAQNTRVLPWRDAWELTFTTNGMCEVCRAVSDAKNDESGNAATSSVTAAKEPVVFQASARVVINPPAGFARVTADPRPPAHEPEQPPTPPPRRIG